MPAAINVSRLLCTSPHGVLLAKCTVSPHCQVRAAPALPVYLWGHSRQPAMKMLSYAAVGQSGCPYARRHSPELSTSVWGFSLPTTCTVTWSQGTGW